MPDNSLVYPYQDVFHGSFAPDKMKLQQIEEENSSTYFSPRGIESFRELPNHQALPSMSIENKKSIIEM